MISSVFIIVCGITTLEAFSLKVKTENGYVKGTELRSMYTWRGIPFAKPPVGNLRFEPPQRSDNWEDIWDATYDRSSCTSMDTNHPLSTTINPAGSEDCLYISVYAPNCVKKNSSLPVMVWIYGGGFVEGNNTYSNFGPDPLVNEGVIVVTFNYRLGIFGFLSTGDDAAPGNNGLRDQIFALKWVERNIRAFGGNPKKVTIFGESAGSVSVSYLLLSPLTKGLFSGAIMESGSALCAWALYRTARENAFATGAELGIITTDSQKLVKRLKTVPEKDLQRAATIAMTAIASRDPANGLAYTPVVEPPGPNAVVTLSSYEKLQLGDFQRVPQIIGYNSAEALYFKKGAASM